MSQLREKKAPKEDRKTVGGKANNRKRANASKGGRGV